MKTKYSNLSYFTNKSSTYATFKNHRTFALKILVLFKKELDQIHTSTSSYLCLKTYQNS